MEQMIVRSILMWMRVTFTIIAGNSRSLSCLTRSYFDPFRRMASSCTIGRIRSTRTMYVSDYYTRSNNSLLRTSQCSTNNATCMMAYTRCIFSFSDTRVVCTSMGDALQGVRAHATIKTASSGILYKPVTSMYGEHDGKGLKPHRY